MTQSRHQPGIYTPGSQNLGVEIVRFDESIQDEYNKLTNRKRELAVQLAAVQSEQKQIMVNLGGWVSEGCDYKEYTDRLTELKAEAEALQAGIKYLDDKSGLLKRQHTWLK